MQLMCAKDICDRNDGETEYAHKKTHSWMKHIDFILLDVLCLHWVFILAYMTRRGVSNPSSSPEYLALASIYTLMNILVLLVNKTMKNVLKREYHKEIAQTFRHVAG